MKGCFYWLESPNIRNVGRFLRFLKPYWQKGLHASLWMALSVFLQLPVPLLTMYIIDQVLTDNNLVILNWICLVLIVIILFQFVSHLMQRYLLLIFKERVLFDIQLKLFEHIEGLSYKFFQSQQTGYLMSRIQSDTSAVHGLLADTVINFCKDVLTFMVGLTIIFIIHWKLALSSIIVLPFFILSLTSFSEKLRSLSKETREKYANVSKILQESLTGIYLIQSFCREKYQVRKIFMSLKNAIKINIKSGIMALLAGNLTSLIGSIGPLIVLWYGGSEIIRGNLTIGQLFAFNSFLAYLFGPTQRLVNLNFSVQQSLGAIERIFELFDLEPDIKEAPEAQELNTINGQIIFDAVSFSYNGHDDALKDVSFAIEPGEVVAIVGYSGAGKTTLINLIPRFYDPKQGSIMLDGRDIRNVKLKFLRAQIGIVAQDTFLFSGTIRDNLRFGNPRATEDEVVAAAKAANAHAFIINLPQSYDTEVGERGVKLSGGEKQRISIARTILKNPKILILDEATSSVDSQSENLIQQALSRLMKGRTTLIIAHRLSTVLSADRIVVLHNGKIIAEGKHQELYQKCAVYKKLFDEQFRTAKNQLSEK